MKILELPNNNNKDLEKFCINELNFECDVDKIKVFLYCIIYEGDNFINLTKKDMYQYIKQFNIDISYGTVCYYFNKIKNLDWIFECGEDEYIRSAYDDEMKCRVYISNTYYKNIWIEFFNDNEVIKYQKKLKTSKKYKELEESYKFYMLLNDTNAGNIVINKLKNLRFKKNKKKLLNGIYNNEFNKLRKIIPYNEYNNILSVKTWLIERKCLITSFLEECNVEFYN